MWIRSQSLAVLVKANEICIEDKTKIWAEGYLIGKYSTEEKALLVLDMQCIQKMPCSKCLRMMRWKYEIKRIASID